MDEEKPEQVQIERVGWNKFRVCYDGRWVTINPYDTGYSRIRNDFPAIKAAHGCKCGQCDK